MQQLQEQQQQIQQELEQLQMQMAESLDEKNMDEKQNLILYFFDKLKFPRSCNATCTKWSKCLDTNQTLFQLDP